LQILNGSTPIGYGPDSNAPGNTNQWQVANIAQGVSSYVIPLGVRYIQTGSTVTPAP
jgi:type 1 fimbria pilin